MSQTTIDQVPPDADQAEFDADMAYMRGLVDAIEGLGSLPPLDPVGSHELDELDEAIAEVQYLFYDRRYLLGYEDPGETAEVEEPARFWTLRRILVALFACIILAGSAVGWAARADAAPGIGCETIRWGFLGSQLRTVCDTPKRADGSWTRERRIWTPAGYVPRSTYCGTYSCSSSGGYYRDETTQGYEQYVVFDYNVLPDEPGWLPTGSVVIR